MAYSAYIATSGPQGDQGPIGVQGSQGFQGEAGTSGELGFQGPQGDQGFQGFQGDQGFQGFQGFQGDQGVQGAQGNTLPVGGGITDGIAVAVDSSNVTTFAGLTYSNGDLNVSGDVNATNITNISTDLLWRCCLEAGNRKYLPCFR